MMEIPDTRSNRRRSRRQEELTTLKVLKLEKQRELANEFNRILTCEGGLNEQSRRICKNLEYAIAIATRPGEIEYYQPPHEVQRIVENGDLVALNSQIIRLQCDLDQIEEDIRQTDVLSVKAPQNPDSVCSNLAEWFMAYGEPNSQAKGGVLTSFQENTKIYGGTSHHRAFKTQAKVMNKGRLTR